MSRRFAVSGWLGETAGAVFLVGLAAAAGRGDVPAAELTRVDELTNQRRFDEAWGEVVVLIKRHPAEPSLVAYRDVLDRLRRLKAALPAAAGGAAPTLSARELIDLKTLQAIHADLEAASQEPSRAGDAKRFATELLARSDLVGTRLAGIRELWAARAQAALLLDRADDGRTAAERLVALGAVDAGDPALEEILIQSNRRGWMPRVAGAPATTRAAAPANVAPPAPSALAFGLEAANARRVVFLCDSSGSMAGTLQTIAMRGLIEAVDRLEPTQSFGVVLFRDGEPASLRRGTAIPATPEHKALVKKFLNAAEVRGGTDPVPAIREGFALRPDVIFIVTDGAFDEPQKVIAELKRLNATRRVRVNIVHLVATDPDNPAARPIVEEGRKVLSAIASANGGEYRLVRPSDMR